MAAPQLSPQDLSHLHDFANRWGEIIARQAFGDQGPGLDVDLLTLEQAAQAAAQGLLEGILATLLEQQAQALSHPQPCPQCHRPCLVRREPRALHCRGGTVPYAEPVCHCPDCRRDFFPLAAGTASVRP